MHESHPAVVVGTQSIDYPTLHRDIRACARWLEQQLVGTDVRIAVGLRHDYWHWVVTLALLQLGKCCATVYAPGSLSPSTQASFDVWLLDGHSSLPARVIEFNAQAVRELNGQQAEAGMSNQRPPGLSLNLDARAARLLFTSGSTGSPKAVVMTASDIRERLQAAAQQYGPDLSSDTRLLTLMGIDTIGAFLVTLLTWLRGGTVLMGVPATDGHGNTQWPFVQSNLLSASPARLKELLDKTQGIWPGRERRQVRVGGARLHPVVRDEALRRVGYRVQSTYGSTELGLVATCDARMLDEHPGAAGQIFSNVRVEIVDEDDRALPFGEPGRVRCKTSGMALGYEGEATSAQFRDGWFYPGDLGTLSAGGVLVVTGRDTDVLNLGGLKLSAVELETRLLHVPGLQDVAVVAVDEQESSGLVIAVVCDGSSDLTVLRALIEAALPQPLPFHLVRVQTLPRNAMGKLPRALIASRLAPLLAQSDRQEWQGVL